MSGEEDFRRRFVRALRPRCFCEYMASMTATGVPDAHLVVEGRAYWLELKYTDHWPVRGSSNVLGHRFSAPQLAFLRRVDRAGGRGLGVIGYKKTHLCVLTPSSIADDGSVSRDRLQEQLSLDLGHKHFADMFLTLLARS